MVMGPSSYFSIAVSDMSDTRHSVVVDMIMVQVFSLVLGSFLILAFGAQSMSAQQLTWMMGSLFVSFSLVGIVYRSLSKSA